jgi:type VI secretion system protein ImpG
MPAFPRTSLRDLAEGAERFARAVPAVAAALARPVPEPMTERLVEGISLLGATLLDKTRDGQRYAYELLAERCCPWLRRPLPAATIVAFDPPLSGSILVPSSTLLLSVPVEGIRCTFRPLRDVVVSAFRVEEASIEASPGRATIVRIRLRSTGSEPLNQAISDGIALYVDGQLETALQVVHALTSEVSRAVVDAPGWNGPIEIDPAAIARSELEPAAALAPDPDGRPQAFGAFVESAVFPDKFRFLRLPKISSCHAAPPTDCVVLSFHLRHLSLVEARLRPSDIRAHCVPVVNLFTATTEPLPLDTVRGEVPIRIVGLPRRGGGVYAVTDAVAVAQRGEHPPVPLPNVRRLAAARSDPRCQAVFVTSLAETADEDPDVTVTFGQGAQAPADDIARVVSMNVLATNRALGARVRTGDVAGTLRVGHKAIGVRSITPASPYIPPPSGESFALRVLRCARVTEGGRDPLSSLKDILFQTVPSWMGREEWIRAQHLQVLSLESLEVTIARRTGADGGVRRGYAYRLVVDESAFRGPGALALFGATVGEALSRSAPVGTFVELSLVGRKGTFAAVFPKEMDK